MFPSYKLIVADTLYVGIEIGNGFCFSLLCSCFSTHVFENMGIFQLCQNSAENKGRMLSV